MTQTTGAGGHYLETHDCLVRLDHLSVGRGVESPAVAAWRAYVDHMKVDCEGCRPSPRDCPTANGLWSAYADTRPRA